MHIESPWIDNMHRADKLRRRQERIAVWAVVATVWAVCGWALAILILVTGGAK